MDAQARTLACDFCRGDRPLRLLIRGRDVAMCPDCTRRLLARLLGPGAAAEAAAAGALGPCRFCGGSRGKHELRLAAEGAVICADCLAMAAHIFTVEGEDYPPKLDPGARAELAALRAELDRRHPGLGFTTDAT